MNVYFDASVLGIAQFDLAARTGVFRSVENLFVELRKKKEIQLHLTATEGIRVRNHVLNYLAQIGALEKDLVPNISGLARVYGFLEKVRSKSSTRLQKKVLWESLKLIERLDSLLPNHYQRGLFHSPFWKIPENIQRDKSLGKLLTVYDLWPIISNQEGDKAFLQLVLYSLPREGWALCISEKTKNDLLNYRKDLETERVMVTHLGIEPIFSPASENAVRAVTQKFGVVDRPYFVTVGAFSERKNLVTVLEAFMAGKENGSLKEGQLLLVGAKAEDLNKVLKNIQCSSAFKRDVVATGYLEDQDLVALYSGARAFLYPSLYEGFGLPVIEAMACRTPVLAADSGSIPEVAGGAAELLPPKETEAWLSSMVTMLSDSEHRRIMIGKGAENAKRFTWEKSAQKTLQVYRAAMEELSSGYNPDIAKDFQIMRSV